MFGARNNTLEEKSTHTHLAVANNSSPAAFSEVLKRYTELTQAINLEHPGEIRDYPSLLNLAIHHYLQTLLARLAELGKLEGNALEVAFNPILEAQWRLTQGSALDIFNNPDNVANSCLKEIAKLIYPGLTEEGLLLKLAPGIKKITQAVYVNPAQGKMDFELKTEAIHPETLEEIPPDDCIVVNDTLFSASSLFACFNKFDFTKKMRRELEQKYPEIYAELIEKRDDIGRVFEVLKQERPSPREAITRLMNALKYSRSRFSGEAKAAPLAEYELAGFRKYLNSLESNLQKQVYQLTCSGAGSKSLETIIKTDLVKEGDCVETAAGNLSGILENVENTPTLDARPPQPSPEELRKSFKEAIKPFKGNEKGEYLYPAKKSFKIPTELTDPLLKNIKIQDATHLIVFLQNLDVDYLKKLPPDEVNPFIRDAEELQYVLFHLDPLKQKAFCRYAAQNLKLFFSIKNSVDVLKNANSEQRLLILDILKDRLLSKGNQAGLIQDNWAFNQFLGLLDERELNLVLPTLRELLLAPENQHFLGRWEFRRLLFKEKATVYLTALGPLYLRSVIRNAEDLWEWERNLPSLAAVQVLHEQLGQRSNAQPSLFQAPQIDEAFIKRYEGHKYSQHLVLGEPLEAKEMVAANPNLLLAEEEVIDYFGRHIKQPAYELPRCIEDEEMAEMQEPYIDQLENSREIKEKLEALERWIESTGGFEDPQRETKDKVALINLVEALKKAETPEALKLAEDEFRTHLKSQTGVIIRKGKHCNTKLLDQASALYDDEYQALGGRDYNTSPKNDSLWVCGIGTIQSSFTTCYAQALGQSLYDRLEELKENKPQSRSLEFRYDRGVFLFPLVPGIGLGYKYASGSVATRARMGGLQRGLGELGASSLLDRLCQAKTSAFRALRRRPDNPSKRGCSIM